MEMYDQRDCGGAARYVESSTHWTRPSSDTSSLGRLFPDGSTWRACPMAVGRIAVAGARLGPESSPTPGMTSRTGHEEEGNLDTHAHNRLDMTSMRTRRERGETDRVPRAVDTSTQALRQRQLGWSQAVPCQYRTACWAGGRIIGTIHGRVCDPDLRGREPRTRISAMGPWGTPRGPPSQA